MHGWFNYTNNAYDYFRKEAFVDQWEKMSDLSTVEGLTAVKGPSWQRRLLLWLYRVLGMILLIHHHHHHHHLLLHLHYPLPTNRSRPSGQFYGHIWDR